MEKGKLTENGSENTGRGMRRKESSGDGKEGESIRKNGWKRKKYEERKETREIKRKKKRKGKAPKKKEGKILRDNKKNS